MTMRVTHAHVTHGTSGRKGEMMSSVTGGDIFGREREVFGRGEEGGGGRRERRGERRVGNFWI